MDAINRELNRQAAHRYHAAGWQPVLLRPGSKQPAFPDWPTRLMGPQEIDFQLRRAAFNVGLLLRDVLVLDQDGATDQWAGLRSSMEVLTAKGSHRYFQLTTDIREVRTRIRLVGCFDVLMGSRVAAAPPSVVSATEHRYAFAPGTGLVRPGDLPPPPRELVEALNAKEQAPDKPTTPPESGGDRYAQAALRYELKSVAAAREGTRNATLNRAAFCLGGLVAAGLLSREAVEAALVAAALASGLGEKEIAATLKSGLTAGLKRPRIPR